MGTIEYSVAYERSHARLPPLEELRQRRDELSERRVDSFANRIDGRVLLDRHGDAELVASRHAARSEESLFAMQRLDRQYSHRVRAARASFLRQSASTGSLRNELGARSLTTQQIHEAVRDCARDSVHKEELFRRHHRADRDNEYARRRAQAFDAKQREEDRLVGNKKAHEADYRERKRYADEHRKSNAASTGAEREAERSQMEKIRQSHENKLAEERAARAAVRDAYEKEKERKAEMQALEREAALERRRAEKAALKQQLRANKAETNAKMYERALLDAEAEVAQCRAALDSGEVDAPYHAAKVRKLEKAERKLADARDKFEENRYTATHTGHMRGMPGSPGSP